MYGRYCVRVDADVLEALKASGKGWHTRVNTILLQAVLEQRWRCGLPQRHRLHATGTAISAIANPIDEQPLEK